MKMTSVLPVLAAVVTACTAPAFMHTRQLASADTDPGVSAFEAMLPSEQLSYDENGNAYYEQGGQVATGKFSLKPNFLLGDVNQDGVVDASDAALILSISAELGSSVSDASARITVYADVNQDGEVNSLDALETLMHTAKGGAEGTSEPIGTTYYYAAPNGMLLSGLIEDEETGDVYYADEDFRLLTGWISDESGCCFCLGDDGAMLMNTWATLPNGTRCWLDSDGSILTNGWLDIAGEYYYLDENGNPVTGMQSIGGKEYIFDENGLRFENIAGEEEASGSMLSGWQEIDGKRFYFDPDSGEKLVGCWIELDGCEYCLDSEGVMLTGWQVVEPYTYYLDENGVKQTGVITVDGKVYYLNEVGIREAGWKSVNGQQRYFLPAGCYMATGLTEIGGSTYYFDDNGVLTTGWIAIGGADYFFNEDGTMQTGSMTRDGMVYEFGADGTLDSSYAMNPGDINTLLNTTVRGETKREITVYNRQTDPWGIDFTIRLSDNDIAIIEQFAAEHFPENSTMAEKLYITHQWIHYNVDYAYAGEKWNSIVNKSYVDAIFNYKRGQCVQYNGAMASVLAYYGYDVYMVRGWTSPGTQHYWTECNVAGTTYLVECGNSGKNGDWWQHFFDVIDNPGAYQ